MRHASTAWPAGEPAGEAKVLQSERKLTPGGTLEGAGRLYTSGVVDVPKQRRVAGSEGTGTAVSQVPLLQVAGAAQTLPQRPQWVASLARFTHLPAQKVRPVAQVPQALARAARVATGWTAALMKTESIARRNLGRARRSLPIRQGLALCRREPATTSWRA